MLFCATKQKSVETRLINRGPGDCLVVNFRDSMPPLVWQLGLGNGRSATVTLRGKDNDWSLGVVDAQGAFTAVAHFDNRQDAEDAYEAVQTTLMKGRSCRGANLKRWILSVIAVIVIVLAVDILLSVFFGKPAKQTSMTGPAPAAEIRNGEPIPADDFLKNAQP